MEKNTEYTRRMYNKYAEEYAKSFVSERFYNNYIEIPAIKKFMTCVRGKRVLDVGCSIGMHSKILVSRGAKLYGIDVSKEMIRIAKSRVPKGVFSVADMKRLPFKNSSFDVVFYGLSIHYVEDLKKAMEEAHRVLKKNGRLIISTDNPYTTGRKKIRVQGKKYYVIDNYFRRKTRMLEMVPGMMLKVYTRTIEELFNPIIDAGFVIIKIKEPVPVPKARKIDAEEYGKCMKRPCFIIIEARKG